MKNKSRIGKRIVSALLAVFLMAESVPLEVFAWKSESGTLSVENDYIKVTVNQKNGGYSITTKEGDVTKETDNDKALLHSGEEYDSSFASFQVGGENGKGYIFGNHYLFSEPLVTTSDANGITSTYRVGDLSITQRIELVNNASSRSRHPTVSVWSVPLRRPLPADGSMWFPPVRLSVLTDY